MNGFDLTRRAALGGFSLLASSTAMAAGSLGPTRNSSTSVSEVTLATPQDHLEAYIKLQASTESEVDCPWWYEGKIYGLRDGEPARPLVRFEGLEAYWPTQLEDGSYRLQGNTLTFFRDFETNEMIYEFDNPYTGKTNEVKPNILGGGNGVRHTTNGIYWEGMEDMFPKGPLSFEWMAAGDMVILKSTRAFPPGIPLIEAQTVFAPRSEFEDKDITRFSSGFASTYMAPWLFWMDMRGERGQTVWHAFGRKLASVDDLPDEYRERAEREHPDRLSGKPGGEVLRPEGME